MSLQKELLKEPTKTLFSAEMTVLQALCLSQTDTQSTFGNSWKHKDRERQDKDRELQDCCSSTS